MRYRVAMVQEIWEEATVYVDARTAEEAEEKARRMADKGDDSIKWQFLEAPNPVEIVAVDAEGSIARLAK